VRRTVLVSDQPALLRMAAGLDFFQGYPYGCTEQRLSRAAAFLALRKFRGVLSEEGGEEASARRCATSSSGSRRRSTPTAWSATGPAAAATSRSRPGACSSWSTLRAGGFAVDQKLFDTLTNSLDQALRSDYSHFIDGEAFAERAWALSALADAGKFNPGYAAELARRAQFLDLEGVSEVALALARQGDTQSSTVEGLVGRLWDGIVIRLYEGKEQYGGLQQRFTGRNGLILPARRAPSPR